MELFETKFRDSMKSSVPLLDKITAYIVKRKGKQLRPMFVFLSAKLCGEVNDSTYRAAALIELLHTATLVHDDVVNVRAVRIRCCAVAQEGQPNPHLRRAHHVAQ